MSIETAALIVLIALAIAMPAVFFREHNRNVKKMKEIGDGLEKMLNPKDKVYTLLGTSLGFRALYKIDRGIYKRAEAVLILLPRHSLIYYPVSKITSKHDKIIFKMEYAQNLDLSPSTIERKRKFCGDETKNVLLGREKFVGCGKDVSKLAKMAESLRKPENLLRLSYENKILFIEFKSAAAEVLSDIQNILSIASSMIARS